MGLVGHDSVYVVVNASKRQVSNYPFVVIIKYLSFNASAGCTRCI